jgi:hypothetical protein
MNNRVSPCRSKRTGTTKWTGKELENETFVTVVRQLSAAVSGPNFPWNEQFASVSLRFQFASPSVPRPASVRSAAKLAASLVQTVRPVRLR